MKHNLFTREIIADFVETRLKHLLSISFILTRNQVIERFDAYAQDKGLQDLRMYTVNEDGYTFKEYYDRQSKLIAALIEYSLIKREFSYVYTVCIEGYYKLKFYADPLDLAEWKKFISCIKGENKHDGEQEAKS